MIIVFPAGIITQLQPHRHFALNYRDFYHKDTKRAGSLGNSLGAISTLAQEHEKIEIAGRMAEAGQKGGAFGAVLRAVIDNVGKALP